MALFDSETYLKFRPLYPHEVFRPLADLLGTQGFQKPYQIADVACGTGHSTRSLLASGIPAQIEAIEPDAKMLATAQEFLAHSASQIHFRAGIGENTGLDDSSMDAVMVASAYHWMDRDAAREEFLRILRPGGVLHLFEYQFPKSLSFPELNDWIRKGFNLHWKAPGQMPRGSFKELTQNLRDDPRLQDAGFRAVPMAFEMTASELTGLLISQSRVIHYEKTLSPVEKEHFREEVFASLGRWLGAGASSFDFKLTSATFLVR